MRPLYMYYQNLRKAISKAPRGANQTVSAPNSRQNSTGVDNRNASFNSAQSIGGGSVRERNNRSAEKREP